MWFRFCVPEPTSFQPIVFHALLHIYFLGEVLRPNQEAPCLLFDRSKSHIHCHANLYRIFVWPYLPLLVLSYNLALDSTSHSMHQLGSGDPQLLWTSRFYYQVFEARQIRYSIPLHWALLSCLDSCISIRRWLDRAANMDHEHQWEHSKAKLQTSVTW